MAQRFPWYLRPLVWLFKLACMIASMVGRIAAIALGIALIVVGFLLTLSIIGAIIGLPLMLFGAMLLLCAIR